MYYIIKGTAEDPEYVFESDPPMEQQDIYCYTLFNKPCYAFDSWQNALVQNGGSSPTDLLTGVLLDEVEALATENLEWMLYRSTTPEWEMKRVRP